MNNYTREAFFTYNANFNNILVCWLSGREERLTLAKFTKLPDCNIMLEGITYSLKGDNIHRVA